MVTHPHTVKDKRQVVPGAFAGLWAKHGVEADDVQARRQCGQEQVLGEHFHAEHVRDEGASPEALHREGAQDALQ